MAKMSAKDKRMADMKRRFQKTSPSKNIGQSISQRLLNDIFGKSKAMGVDSDPKGMMSLKKDKKDKLVATGTKGVERPKKKGKVDPGLQKALKNKKKSSTTGNVSQGSTMAKKKVGSSTKTKTGGKVKATAANTKNYASTLALQNRLIKKGAKIKADGVMGPKTRAAMKKFMTSPNVPKKNGKKVMVDDFKKALVNKTKKTSKTGLGTKVMSTKTPKKYKGTNITPTKLQRDRMRKRMMGST